MDTTIAKIITLLLSVVGRVTAIRSYVIPLSLNPFIQSPIRLSGFVKTMYNAHVNFYSKVTLTDVSDDTEKDLKDLVEKKLSVVFLTTHSSYVAKTLTLSDLKFSGPSKWSYNISIDDMIMVSNGSITEFNQDMELYKFQEMAMKVLENRYSFSMSKIQNELGYTMMEFLGADEKQWIDIVGIITQSVIDNQCEKLKITSCYLAKLINKTLDEIKAFTLHEVDKHLYNTTMLTNKLKHNLLAKTNATNSVSSIHPNASASMTDLQMISSTSSGTGVIQVTSSVKINSTNTKVVNSSERSFNSKMGILLLMLIPVIYQ